MTAREFAEHWKRQGYPRNVVNPITGKTEPAAFVTLWSGPGEDDADPPDDEEVPEAAE
jgi:hypothetical protein